MINPPPILAGWGEAKNGPVPVWALWFQNVFNILNNDVSGTLTIASAAGTITSYTATYRYKNIGAAVSLLFDITITNAGTGSGALLVTIPNKTVSNIYGSAVELATGFACSCLGVSNTTFSILKYDNTGMIATGRRFIGTVNYYI